MAIAGVVTVVRMMSLAILATTPDPLPAGDADNGLRIAYAALALFAVVLLTSYLTGKIGPLPAPTPAGPRHRTGAGAGGESDPRRRRIPAPVPLPGR